MDAAVRRWSHLKRRLLVKRSRHSSPNETPVTQMPLTVTGVIHETGKKLIKAKLISRIGFFFFFGVCTNMTEINPIWKIQTLLKLPKATLTWAVLTPSDIPRAACTSSSHHKHTQMYVHVLASRVDGSRGHPGSPPPPPPTLPLLLRWWNKDKCDCLLELKSISVCVYYLLLTVHFCHRAFV